MRSLLLLLAAALLSAQSPEPRAALEGTVVNAVTGEPVPRATVRLISTPPRVPLRSAVTSEEGRFQFGNLDPGSYFLTVAQPGFLMDHSDPAQHSLRLRLEPGQTRRGLVHRITPESIITGRVLDEFGRPVQGALLLAYASRRSRGRDLWLDNRSSATTNGRGEFRLIHLDPGRYVVAAQYQPPPAAPGAARKLAYAFTYYPQTADVLSARPVETAAGRETTGIDIRLRKELRARLRGRVTGVPAELSGLLEVILCPRSLASPAQLVAPSFARLGPAGAFEIADVPAGEWVIRARMGAVSDPASYSSFGSAPVTVNGRDVDGLVIGLTPGVPLRGVVSVEGGSAAIRNDALSVALRPSGVPQPGAGAGVRVQPDGAFAFAAPAGKYAFRMFGPAPPNAYFASVRLGGVEYLDRELDLTGGAPGPLRVVYRLDAATVLCKVERESGTGPAVTVALVPAELPLRTAPFVKIQTIGADSPAEFRRVRPGRYLAFAVDAADFGTLLDGDIPQALLDAAVPLQAEPNGSHELTLKPLPVPAH